MENNKIGSLADLVELTESLRKAGKTIALCHGTFDLMHIGHIKHLQSAAQKADALFVTVTSDRYINKGPGRPVFNQQLRLESLAALSCVTRVAVNDEETSVNVLELIKPDVYVKGSDYQNEHEDITGNIRKEREAVEKHGGRIVYTDEPTSSSSALLNNHFDVFSPEVSDYLGQIKKQYTAGQILEQLDRLKDLKVLVVGEAIVDEYHYISSLGQTGKDNVLAVKHEHAESFAGGAIAVANHVAGFVEQVTLMTVLGHQNSREEFIRRHLLENVTPQFFYALDRQTIVKRRYVDGNIAKLFEVYFYNEQNLPQQAESVVMDWLETQLQEFDVVIVADFGNGFISDAMAQVLAEKAPYLAVNAQTNSGNRGYHFVTRYPSADFISLNEPELRMTMRDRKSSIHQLARQLSEHMKAKAVAVTRGAKGALMAEAGGQRDRHEIPALARKVIDRIGAGDAFLAITGLCMGKGVPADMSLLVGNAAAALDVQIVCNRDPVNAVALRKYLTTLLK